MDVTNLSHLHIVSTDENLDETVEIDIGASWDSKAWDNIFDDVDDELDEEVVTS